MKEWVTWVLVVPIVVALLAIVRVATAPFEYVSYRRERAREKTQLREELRQLERRPLLRPLPEKTLWELWRVYGFEDRRFPESVCLELASAWIDRLYGPETTRAVDLMERMERVTQRRAKARAEAPHIGCMLFGPRLEQVLKELAVELPPYDWAGRAEVPASGGESALSDGRRGE